MSAFLCPLDSVNKVITHIHMMLETSFSAVRLLLAPFHLFLRISCLVIMNITFTINSLFGLLGKVDTLS